MADPSLPFHERLRAAIEASGAPDDTLQEKMAALQRHVAVCGGHSIHVSGRTLARWIAGRGFPPPYWCAIAAGYLGVSIAAISPRDEERLGALAKVKRPSVQRRTPVPHRNRVAVPAERWARETVYVVGGGPSAGRHDLTRLHEHGILIAVNDSAVRLPGADVVFSASPPWCRHREKLLREHSGQLVVRIERTPSVIRQWSLPADTVVLPLRNVPGASEEERALGHNSGTEAIYWAASQGARRIVLIGFDMECGKPGHWHGGYEWFPDRETRRDSEDAYPLWARNMRRVARDLRAAGVECLNANPTSAITAFQLAELPVPMVRRDGLEPLGRPLSCAGIIPVGPGHEGYSDQAVRSVVRAWERNPGPFTHLQLRRVWDRDGSLGPSRARNLGMDKYSADWHFCLDADDEMMPEAFRLVDLEASATFGAVMLDGQVSGDNVWPLDRQGLRERGALGTISMGCFVRGDLGLRFREDLRQAEDFDFYCRLPDFTKRREPLVNIGYRKPSAGVVKIDREAAGWLYACNAVITAHLGPPAKPRPIRLNDSFTTEGTVST